MKERREHARFRIDQVIEVSYSRETYIYIEGVNLSESGMMCRSNAVVDAGNKLYIMFSVTVNNETSVIRCEGIVVRSMPEKDEYQIGIQFSGLSDEDRKKIREYCEDAPEAP